MGHAATSYAASCLDLTKLELVASGRFTAPVAVLRLSDNDTHRQADATASVMQELAQAMHRRCIAPCLKAATREEFYSCVGQSWPEFLEMSDSLHALVSLRAQHRPPELPVETNQKELFDLLKERALAVAGEEAEGEIEFVSSTYSRALRLVPKIKALAVPVDRREESAVLARRFNAMAAVYTFGSYLIIAGARREATDVAVSCAFELLRTGALEAYGATRDALELRQVRDHSEVELDPVSDEEVRNAVALAEADLVAL